jgi:hypothetical protein
MRIQRRGILGLQGSRTGVRNFETTGRTKLVIIKKTRITNFGTPEIKNSTTQEQV